MGLCATVAVMLELLQDIPASVATLQVPAIKYSLECALKMGIGLAQHLSVIAVSDSHCRILSLSGHIVAIHSKG